MCKRKCDNCKHLINNMSQTVEYCGATDRFYRLSKWYAEQRLNAEKSHCKEYKSIN